MKITRRESLVGMLATLLTPFRRAKPKWPMIVRSPVPPRVSYRGLAFELIGFNTLTPADQRRILVEHCRCDHIELIVTTDTTP